MLLIRGRGWARIQRRGIGGRIPVQASDTPRDIYGSGLGEMIRGRRGGGREDGIRELERTFDDLHRRAGTPGRRFGGVDSEVEHGR